MSSFRNQLATQRKQETDERETMCRAQECPNRWSVSEGHLCSAHAWAPPEKWYDITNEQLRLFAARQGAEQQPRYRPVSVMTESQRKATIAKLAQIAKSGERDHKAWAYRLRDRERNGEQLSAVQRQMWRDVLKEQS